MTAVLLAGGKSSRMGYHPKQQLMLDGESFQTRILKQLQGFGEIAISRRKVNEENAEENGKQRFLACRTYCSYCYYGSIGWCIGTNID